MSLIFFDAPSNHTAIVVLRSAARETVASITEAPARDIRKALAPPTLSLRRGGYCSAEYFAFVRRLQQAGQPDGSPTHCEQERCRWVRSLMTILALSAMLSGCAAGALTCTSAYDEVGLIRPGATCEFPRAFRGWTAAPKGM